MGIKERKKREKIKRRDDIINAAERIFFNKNFENATMEEIAIESELSIGTLYKYFNNKIDLYLAITKRGIEILEKLFHQAIKNKNTGIDKVLAIGEAYVQFYNKYPNYFKTLMFYETKNLNLMEKESWAAKCNLSGDETLKILVNAIQEGMDDGTILDTTNPVYAAIAFWGFSTGLLQLINNKGVLLKDKFQDDNIDPEEVLKYSFQLLYESIRTKKPE